MAMSAEHRSIFAALYRQWFRLHMSEKFTSLQLTKNPKQTNKTNKQTNRQKKQTNKQTKNIIRFLIRGF